MALLLALLLAAAAADVAVSGDLARFSPDVIKAADFAISAQNRMSNYPYAYKVMSVLSDTAQIYPPARVKYSMVVEVGETACKNTQSLKLSDCVLQNLPNTKVLRLQHLLHSYSTLTRWGYAVLLHS
uniref:Cystatin domain-containing protein n=1 Tax=Denticeps clupeoides TaxID=299321 RepID=A0AAY3ZZ09_9TELE